MGETDDLEWDDIKDAANRENRDLPFPLAAVLFDGRPRVDSPSRHPTAEGRFETLAEKDGDVLLCVWTWRSTRRRVISLRYANRKECRAYQEAVGGGRAPLEDG